MSTAETGVKRRVVFQGWCHRCVSGWTGPERDAKWHALLDVTGHNLDRHGGAAGRGES